MMIEYWKDTAVLVFYVYILDKFYYQLNTLLNNIIFFVPKIQHL